MEEQAGISAADIEEQDAIHAAVQRANAFRTCLEAVGLSYAEFLGLKDASRELSDIAHNVLIGWERGEFGPMGAAIQGGTGKERKMTRPKANKTSLYKLVSAYIQLPARKQTIFQKTHQRPSYWLEWQTDSYWCKAYFAAALGRPVLAITRHQDGREVFRAVHTLDITDLMERGMVETVTTPAERRRAERGPGYGAV